MNICGNISGHWVAFEVDFMLFRSMIREMAKSVTHKPRSECIRETEGYTVGQTPSHILTLDILIFYNDPVSNKTCINNIIRKFMCN